MEYRYVAQSIEGFVQQLACNYLTHGYWFFVQGWIPDGKAVESVDQKLLTRYDVQKSRQQRARGKLSGKASMQYLRFEKRFVLLATHGHHLFFQEEEGNIRDLRRASIEVGGYSVSVRKGQFLRSTSADEPAEVDGKYRVRVRISKDTLRELKAHFFSLATHRSKEFLAREFYNLPFEPYAPVRKQLLMLYRGVNERRKEAGYELVPITCLRLRRRIVKPFEQHAKEAEVACNVDLDLAS